MEQAENDGRIQDNRTALTPPSKSGLMVFRFYRITQQYLLFGVINVQSEMMENNNICGQPFEAAFCAILSMKPLFFIFDTSVFDQSLTRRKELKKT